MGKSYVGLTQCFYCGEDSGLVLDRRLWDTFETHVGVINMEPCSECKNLMGLGIIMISTRDGESGSNPYRTGGWVVVREEAVRRLFAHSPVLEDILQKRWCFVEDSVWDAIGLPREEEIDNTATRCRETKNGSETEHPLSV